MKFKFNRLLYNLFLKFGLRPTEIYLVTSLTFNKEWGAKYSRCWHWFATEKEAIDSVKNGPSWYSECGYYTHVVIEKCNSSSFMAQDISWFELKYHNDNTYEAINVAKPIQAKQICNWGIG